MNDRRILILVEHQQNRHLLSQTLVADYQVLAPQPDADFAAVGEQMLTEDFDLCFIDYTAIHLLREKMLTIRKKAVPLFLPFVFLTTIKDVGLSTDHLEPLVDEVIHLPIEKIELKTKIRVLMRSRGYSLQLKSTQDKLDRALAKEKEANKIKSRFVSTVSHEFRNPLNSISGMAQILEAYGDKLQPEKKTEVLQQLRRNVTKMTNLLNDVLLVSQKDLDMLQFNPTPVELKVICQIAINEVQTAFESTTINFNYLPEKQEFNLDRHLLDCILTNLLANACKYSSGESVDFVVESQAEALTLIIRDRGIGIPTADLPHLFDAFYRASNSLGHQGTGLGLAIVKNCVEQHQGDISVTSELGIGTTFTITIPAGEATTPNLT